MGFVREIHVAVIGKLNCFGLMDASGAACIHDANRYPKKPKKNAVVFCCL